jgi:hypothetical protein
MAKRFLGLLVTVLLSVPVPCGSGDADNAAQAMGFVCRILTDQNVAVVTPLAGSFIPDSPIRFLDDKGNTCATGIVRSSYPDLSYVALDNGSVDCLKKGFVAFAGPIEEKAKVLCKYSLNLPLVIGKDGKPGHSIPPNAIVINYIEQTMKPVSFRHYAHDIGCRTCHHKDLDTPCRQCHPTSEEAKRPGANRVDFGDCVRERCIGCHKGHEGKSSDCAWCHK